jgi:hypothetical protein
LGYARLAIVEKDRSQWSLASVSIAIDRYASGETVLELERTGPEVTQHVLGTLVELGKRLGAEQRIEDSTSAALMVIRNQLRERDHGRAA